MSNVIKLRGKDTAGYDHADPSVIRRQQAYARLREIKQHVLDKERITSRPIEQHTVGYRAPSVAARILAAVVTLGVIALWLLVLGTVGLIVLASLRVVAL